MYKHSVLRQTEGTMGDVTLLTGQRISKTSVDLSLAKTSLPNSAPAFTLPPRNCRVPAGGTAKFDVKVPGNVPL
ncbi:hypothetical protein GDO86_016671 [Hymenochirus boettgeri]|uniref:Uncharacterized protein n=1 Tax=Hymenochirus boettgeri TaxID=247094 RepID=A0A8T2IPQ2_9PIPI|nr:hypothetical protein GDO86_016671 [Hymenochirus boettgeri]